MCYWLPSKAILYFHHLQNQSYQAQDMQTFSQSNKLTPSCLVKPCYVDEVIDETGPCHACPRCCIRLSIVIATTFTNQQNEQSRLILTQLAKMILTELTEQAYFWIWYSCSLDKSACKNYGKQLHCIFKNNFKSWPTSCYNHLTIVISFLHNHFHLPGYGHLPCACKLLTSLNLFNTFCIVN
jgi:hypothetical protein